MARLLGTLLILGWVLGLVAAVRIGWLLGSLFELLTILPRLAFAALAGRLGLYDHGHAGGGSRFGPGGRGGGRF